MRTLATLAALAASAAQALALSCAQPNLAEDFNRLDEQPGEYFAVLGTLKADVALPPIPERTPENQNVEGGVSAPYTFTGQFLSQTGLGETHRVPVRVKVTCTGMWCGEFPAEDTPSMMFIARDGNDLALTLGPCGGPLKANPTEAQQAAMLACFSAATCGPDEIAAFAAQ